MGSRRVEAPQPQQTCWPRVPIRRAGSGSEWELHPAPQWYSVGDPSPVRHPEERGRVRGRVHLCPPPASPCPFPKRVSCLQTREVLKLKQVSNLTDQLSQWPQGGSLGSCRCKDQPGLCFGGGRGTTLVTAAAVAASPDRLSTLRRPCFLINQISTFGGKDLAHPSTWSPCCPA